jgi:hypothetical protein
MLFIVKNLHYLDLDHTFEDRLEVLLEQLKEYQTLGKEFDWNFYLLFFLICKEPRSKRVANLKKQIAQVRRSITKNLSNLSINNDESIHQRTFNDESSKKNKFQNEYFVFFILVETISSLSPNVSSLNVTKNQSELTDIASTSYT